MNCEAKAEDWQTLGLNPGATLEDVYEAFTRRKAIYAPDALASYSLHDAEDRELLLEKIEAAYLRISRAAGAGAAPEKTPGEEPTMDQPIGPPPSADERPGAHLRHRRLNRRVTLGQLAQETKIRASLIELLESEAFTELPPTVYVRGFVIQCARALGHEDPEGLAAAYLAKRERSE